MSIARYALLLLIATLTLAMSVRPDYIPMSYEGIVTNQGKIVANTNWLQPGWHITNPDWTIVHYPVMAADDTFCIDNVSINIMYQLPRGVATKEVSYDFANPNQPWHTPHSRIQTVISEYALTHSVASEASEDRVDFCLRLHEYLYYHLPDYYQVIRVW